MLNIIICNVWLFFDQKNLLFAEDFFYIIKKGNL